MINGSDFFATEQYLRTRFLALILGGVLILAAVAVGSMYWQLAPRALAMMVIAISLCIASAALIILPNAQSRAYASTDPSPALLDDEMRKTLRGRVRRLQFGVAFFALVFVYVLWETRDGPLLPRLVGASMNLLFQFVLIQAIRRLCRDS
jgi:hypothetical protein